MNYSLTDRIMNIISENNIQNYLICHTTTNSEELFYIKKELQLTRNKTTDKCDVTIYHEFQYDNLLMRGSSSFTADISMTDTELSDKIMSAYDSALSVKNPYYQLPMGKEMFSDTDNTYFNAVKPDKVYSGHEIAEILFADDINTDAFINSAEIFVTCQDIHIINSNGINVSYSDTTYSGEYVVQAVSPNDVELYYDFKYSYLDNDIDTSLKCKLNNSINAVRDRAKALSVANNELKMQYKKIIIEGSSVYDLFSYYLKRLDASMIYPEYSTFSINSRVVPENDDNNETNSDNINITLMPKVPYSSEGIQLVQVPLIEDNIAKIITGNARFSHYLGLPAIGTYESYSMKCGDTSIIEIEKDPHLKIINFSDFQMNELTGQFGGEYRLAYYFDGVNTIPVTNGSISGNINDLVKTMQLSKESQSSYNFEGPLAVTYAYNYL